MKHFKLVKSGIDVRPFRSEIEAVPEAWELSTGRKDNVTVQREAEAIPIRILARAPDDPRKNWDIQHSRWASVSKRFPVIRSFLAAFAAEQVAELSRARLVRLPPGARVYSHFDRGEYYRLRDRFHLIIQGSAGSYLQAGREKVSMKEGELWWFNNKKTHEAWNEGEEDRIHFIFDLLPRKKMLETL